MRANSRFGAKKGGKGRVQLPSDRRLRSFKNQCVCSVSLYPLKDLSMLALKEKKEFTDTIIRSIDGRFEENIHSLIISSLSPLLAQKLFVVRESSVVLPCSAKVLQCMIALAYTGICEVQTDIIKEVLEAAEKFAVKELKKIGCEFLIGKLNEDIAIEFMRIAETYCCAHVVKDIINYICCKFKVVRDVLKLNVVEMMKFMKNENLQMTQEELLIFINSWKEVNKISDHQVKDIMNCVGLRRQPAKVLMVLGGWTFNPSTNIELYDYLNKCWSIANIKLPLDIAYHGAEVIGDKLYVVGGYSAALTLYLNTVYCLDMNSLTWTEVSSMLSKRSYVSTAVIDGQLYALGGHNGFERVKTVERYTPSTNQWEEVADMIQVRSDFGVAVHEGSIWAIGGFDGNSVLDSIEVFNPTEGVWKLVSSALQSPRSGLCVVSMLGRILVLGGYDGTERLKSVECFTPLVTGRLMWHPVPPMLHQRSNFSTCVLDNKLMVIGGYRMNSIMSDTDGEVCSNVEFYDNRENSWRPGKNLNISRSALAVGMVTVREKKLL